MRKIKICLACNGGGHFEQLKLATSCLKKDDYDFFYVTEKSKHLKNLMSKERHYSFINPTTKKHLWVVNTLQALWVLFKERPNVIISTGAGVAFPIFFFGKKIFKAKTIFICSAANVTKPSRVPFQAYKIADLFLVQWRELKEIFPKSTYIGIL